MLNAFKTKPFDLAPVYASWSDGPIFNGDPKKDPPVEEWLERIKAGCVQRDIPEEYWHKVAQHFMGPKARSRLEEVKQVVVKVNGGKYRWSWKKFRIAMCSMGWGIDDSATQTIKVRGKSSSLWFVRKKEDKKEASAMEHESVSRAPPNRSRSLWIRRRPSMTVVEGPVKIVSQSPPRKASSEFAFWPVRRNLKDGKTSSMVQRSGRQETVSEKQEPTQTSSKSSPPTHSDSESSEVVTTVAHAPVWLLNACTALDYLTSEHPKAMSVLSAILITVGTIPAIPAISAGAGGAVLASGAAQAIGAIAVGLGQVLNTSVKGAKDKQS